MNEEDLLKYMNFTEDTVIFDKNFYNNVMLPCFDNSIMYKNIIKELRKENKQLKEQIEYLRRNIERKEDKITDLEQERVPYTNEYVVKLEKENKQLKECLEEKDRIINKIIEIKYNFQNENSLLIFENDNLLKFINDLQNIFILKIRSDK